MSRQVLFLCSGNYYRSRFAELLFNELAARRGLDWRADSRGIVATSNLDNIGPISPFTLNGLADRDIYPARAHRNPMQLQAADLAQADLVIALYEPDHRIMLDQFFPEWSERVEYWQVPDLDGMEPREALERIEQHIHQLIEQLSPHVISEKTSPA